MGHKEAQKAQKQETDTARESKTLGKVFLPLCNVLCFLCLFVAKVSNA